MLHKQDISLCDVNSGNFLAVTVVHEIKGFECDHVAVHEEFIHCAERENMMHPQNRCERNCLLVAFSRHRESLVILKDIVLPIIEIEPILPLQIIDSRQFVIGSDIFKQLIYMIRPVEADLKKKSLNKSFNHLMLCIFSTILCQSDSFVCVSKNYSQHNKIRKIKIHYFSTLAALERVSGACFLMIFFRFPSVVFLIVPFIFAAFVSFLDDVSTRSRP